MLSSLLASSLAAGPAPDKSDHWAVLVAGSSGYGNYRHQADVCHAYQLLKRAGLPEDHIITLAVDDIADSPSNPFKGKIFNKPTPKGTPGIDVYAGCKIDYSGSAVTPETFVKVLTGDASRSNSTGLGAVGPVLRSTKKSRVFVNFVDHGGVGLIGFPKTTMHAKELVSALTTMHEKGMYKELVFYLEACESGSMFPTLPDDVSIYATTAADASHSSYGTYCSPDDKVDGKQLHTCLGDLYSVNWMEDADKATAGETLQDQYTKVKKLTTKSKVLQFGDTSITTELVTAFEGNGAPAPPGPSPGPSPPAQCNAGCRLLPSMIHCKIASCSGCDDCGMAEEAAPKTLSLASPATAGPPPAEAAASLPSADASLSSAFSRFLASGDDGAAEELVRGVRQRQAAKRRFEAIVRKVATAALTPLEGPLDVECHYAAHKAYVRACGEWDAEALAHSATLAKLCVHTGGDPKPIAAAVGEVCA